MRASLLGTSAANWMVEGQVRGHWGNASEVERWDGRRKPGDTGEPVCERAYVTNDRVLLGGHILGHSQALAKRPLLRLAIFLKSTTADH